MIAVGGKGMREIAVLAGIIADEGTGGSGPVVVLLHELAATATAPSAQERLLYQILGIVEGAEHAVTMHMQLPPVALSQRREGSLLAGSHGGNDCRLFGLGGGSPRLTMRLSLRRAKPRRSMPHEDIDRRCQETHR